MRLLKWLILKWGVLFPSISLFFNVAIVLNFELAGLVETHHSVVCWDKHRSLLLSPSIINRFFISSVFIIYLFLITEFFAGKSFKKHVIGINEVLTVCSFRRLPETDCNCRIRGRGNSWSKQHKYGYACGFIYPSFYFVLSIHIVDECDCVLIFHV